MAACFAPEADPLAAAASCGGLSFTAATPVLTASGKAVAISRLSKGDKVIATDVKTGKTGAATVSAVMVHYDTNLFSLKVRSGGGTSVISTTWNHPFWDLTQHKWIQAGELRHGDGLRTPSGGFATVVGGRTPRHHDAWMWDLTVPGPHDFYVVPGRATAVLVHNCPRFVVDSSGTTTDLAPAQVAADAAAAGEKTSGAAAQFQVGGQTFVDVSGRQRRLSLRSRPRWTPSRWSCGRSGTAVAPNRVA